MNITEIMNEKTVNKAKNNILPKELSDVRSVNWICLDKLMRSNFIKSLLVDQIRVFFR